jgi:hypothetical protein
MRAFELSAFEYWVAGHLRRFFPNQCERLSPQEFSESIHHGIARAQAHGFEAGPDICRYMDIMMVFGPSFDQDLLWAKEILEDARIKLSGMRMDLLHNAAVEHEHSPAI